MNATNDIQVYSKAGNIKSKGCNTIMFCNQGECTAVINRALKIRPGVIMALNQVTPQMVDNTTYELSFDTADAYTTGAAKELVVVATFTQTNKSNGSPVCDKY